MILAPYTASAMSVPDIEQQTLEQKADFIKQYVQQKIDGIRSSDPQRAAALEKYLFVAPTKQWNFPGPTSTIRKDKTLRLRELRHDSESSRSKSALASLRSAVSKPSVNQL
jgi:hypothetical protein